MSLLASAEERESMLWACLYWSLLHIAAILWAGQMSNVLFVDCLQGQEHLTNAQNLPDREWKASPQELPTRNIVGDC